MWERLQTLVRAIIRTGKRNRDVKNKTRRTRKVCLKTWRLQRIVKWNAQTKTLKFKRKRKWYFKNSKAKNGRPW